MFLRLCRWGGGGLWGRMGGMSGPILLELPGLLLQPVVVFQQEDEGCGESLGGVVDGLCDFLVSVGHVVFGNG